MAWLAGAGAVGTLARYGLAGWVQPQTPGTWFAWGTLAVNASGCFLFGLVWAVFEKGNVGPEARLYVLTGFMGAFTTFSTYAFETGRLIDEGQWVAALINVATQNVLGLVLLMIGFAIGRLL
jgi:CrcB protein